MATADEKLRDYEHKRDFARTPERGDPLARLIGLEQTLPTL